MPQVSFRPLAETDLALLFTWLTRAHVRRWYAREPSSFMEVLAKYGPRTQPGGTVDAFVIRVDNADAGYIQSYALEDFPAYRALVGCEAEQGVAGMDLLLGDEWRTSRGLGSFVIRRFFLERLAADERLRAFIAGPHEGNAASIRAFEKAGFRRWKVALNERDERECIVRRERDLATYRIAPIDPADRDTCVRMFRDMYRASFGSEEGLEELVGPGNAAYLEQLSAKMAQLPRGNAHLWRDDRIVGQLEMRLVDDPEIAYVSLIHVVPELRAHGLGRMLHAHAMQVAREAGKRLMRLSVHQGNKAAMLFYRRMGWVVVGTRADRASMAIMETPVL